MIAIIAILAAMLLPALNRAKLKVTQAVRVSNQKKLCLAFTMYAGDNAEKLVPYGAADGYWDPYYNGTWAPWNMAVVSSDTAEQLIKAALKANSPLFPCAPNATSIHCPGDVRYQNPPGKGWAFDSYSNLFLSAPTMYSSKPNYWRKNIRLTHALRLVATILILGTCCITCATRAAMIPSPYELATWRGFSTCAVSYTFDDNSPNQFSVAQPMFDARGLHATFFCIVGSLSPSQWATIESASSKGHEIGSHTLSHPDLAKLTDAQVTTEESGAKNLIESHTGKKCVSLAYPYCTVPKESITSQYYLFARSCNESLVPSTPADFLSIGAMGAHSTQMNAASDNAASSGSWLVWLIHGIDKDAACCPIASSVLQSNLDYVATDTNKWWIETFGNVCRYIQERNASVLTVVSNGTTNITLQLTNGLDNTIFNYPVTLRRPMPGGWRAAAITQNGVSVPSQVVNGNLMFDVVPNGGDIVLSKIEKTASHSK